MSESLDNSTALVTGGAGGIGYELCKLIAADGHNLVLVDLNKQTMNQAADQLVDQFGVKVKTIHKDLSTENAAQEIHEELASSETNLKMLINNAGYGMTGEFLNLSIEAQLNMIQVNISSVVALTSYLLPGLLEEENASIMNVASIAAFQAGPYMATYFATKAFVLSWSEALALELADTNVSVTSLCPPPTNTGFAQRAGAQGSLAFNPKAMMTPEEVAKEGYEGLKNKKMVILPGLTNKLAVFSNRLIPRSTSASIAGMVNKRRVENKVSEVAV